MTQAITLSCVTSTTSKLSSGKISHTVWIHSDVFKHKCVSLEFDNDETEQANSFALRAQQSVISREPFQINELDIVRCNSRIDFLGDNNIFNN